VRYVVPREMGNGPRMLSELAGCQTDLVLLRSAVNGPTRALGLSPLVSFSQRGGNVQRTPTRLFSCPSDLAGGGFGTDSAREFVESSESPPK
jgi:hypothetical protein